MKKIKFMALVMALVILVGLFAGCVKNDYSDPVGEIMGSNSADDDTTKDDGTLTGTVTLKQFLDSDPTGEALTIALDNIGYEGIEID